MGGQVTVRGRASAPTGLTRVELFVGEALKDFQVFQPSQTNLEFVLRFDVASVRTDRATMSVVACGGPVGALVRGIASIDVQVDRSAAPSPSAAPVRLTPLDEGRSGNDTGTGPIWVGAAFGLAGLAGLVAATRLSGAREASGPSRARGEEADGGPVRRWAAGLGVSLPRPSPPRRTATATRVRPARPPAPRAAEPEPGRWDAAVRDGKVARRSAVPERSAARPSGGPAPEEGGRAAALDGRAARRRPPLSRDAARRAADGRPPPPG